ncbi:hypothetical protein KAJ27_04105, partial [bacterium]|nr:hypothetical protein [bacterium]
KKIVLVLIVALFLVPGIYCSNDLTSGFHEVIGQYWKIQELRFNNSNVDTEKKLVEAIDKYHNLINGFTENVIIDKFGDSKGLDLFRELYDTCSEYSKPAFDSVIKKLNEKILVANLQGSKVKMLETDIDPNRVEYIYRLGKELERELIKAQWIIERQTYFENVEVTMVVDSELTKPLKLLYPAIFLLKLGSWLINGDLYYCFKTTFITKHKLFFRTVKKIAENKVWFELFRAKKTWFTSPKWELYGKTYKVIIEPTGEELAREMKVLD